MYNTITLQIYRANLLVVEVYLQGELSGTKHDYYALKFEISGHDHFQ